MVKNEDGTYARGDKLAPVRTRLASAGLRSQGAMSAIQGHAGALCRPLGERAPVVRAGALRLAERGCIDGATVSHVKRKRRVDGIMPRKAHRVATQEAIHLAAMAATWEAPPARAQQRMALGCGVEQMWSACAVPLKAWVMQCWQKKKKRTDPSVLVTTDRQRNASGSVRHDAERPESAQDDEQRQSRGWQRQPRRAPRSREVVLSVLTVVLRSSLYHLFAKTPPGTRFADKTRQALALEQLRTPRTHILVDAGGSFAIFETLSFVPMVLHWSPPVQERLRTWLAEPLSQMQKRE